jgi:small subunit ribosomal protein S16
MVTIRLTRVGKKNKPQYRIVVQEKSKATSSDYLEKVGFYNPHDDSEGGLQLNEDRIKHWISKGAETSDTVHNMLVEKGIVEGKKIPKGRPTKKKKEGEETEGEEKKEESPKEEVRAETKEEPKVEEKKEEVPKEEKVEEKSEEKKEEASKEEPKEEKKEEKPEEKKEESK